MTGPVNPRYPNMPRLITKLLVDNGYANTFGAGSQTPADLYQSLPFVRITRAGGGSDHVSDTATVDVEVFADTSLAGEQLAEDIRQFLIEPGLPIVEGYGLIDRVVCVTGPHELPWADIKVRRFGATYRITARRHYVV